MASLTGIYTSPQTNYDDSPAPRIPYGRNPTGRAPYSTIRRVSGPNGEVDSQTDRVPYAPSLPLERGDVSVQLPGTTEPTHMPYGQYANMRGNQIPRGMSPDVQSIRANAQNPNQSIARGAPVLGPPTGPAPVVSAGSGVAPGYGGATQAPVGPNPGGNSPVSGGVSAIQEKKLNSDYKKFGTYIADHLKSGGDENDPNYKFWVRRMGEIRGILGADPGAKAGASPVGTAQATGTSPAQSAAPVGPNPTPYTNPDTGKPQRLAPIVSAKPAPMTPDQRAAGLKNAYDVAGADLAAHPDLGTTATPAPVTVPYGKPLSDPGIVPGGSANDRASQDQVVRNQQATQRSVDANRKQILQTNADQFAQNQGAASAISLRQQQFQKGNYDISEPLKMDDIQSTTDARTAHASLPDGARFVYGGKTYIKGQAGPVDDKPQRKFGQGGQARAVSPGDMQ